MKIKWLFLALLLPVVNTYAGLTQENVTTSAFNSTINGVSFQHDAIITYNGFQYAVYWSANRHVGVARKQLPNGTWQTLELTDYQFTADNPHYDISLGISPRDGTLHLSFDQWSSPFRYRKSVSGLATNPQAFAWNSSLFGPVQNHLNGTTLNPTTYPQFVTSPSGTLLLLLRHGVSGGGDALLYEYDGNTGQWTTLGMFINGRATDINPYFNGMHYDANGRLHTTWVWRATPDASTNYDLHYIYSDDDGRTWRNNSGNWVATTGSSSITENTAGIKVWDINQDRGLINQEAQTVDSQGRVSVLLSHMRDSEPSTSDFTAARHKAHVFHYMRDLSGNWTRRDLAGSSFSYDRNKIVADANNNLYAVINRDGIYRATSQASWNDWTLLQTLNDQTLFGEVQIDRKRIVNEGVLSLLNPARNGRMVVFNYTFDGNASSSAAGGGPVDYRYCALEGGTCSFSGTRDLAYGASGRFYHQLASNSDACNTSNFGDPIRGTVKRCYYSDTTVSSAGAGPVGYTSCANENQACIFSGTRNVAYGANGQFNYRLATGSIACNNENFGDPVNGVVKSCYYSEAGGGSSSSSSSSSSGGGIMVRARGTSGSEHINLIVGGSTVADWTLATSHQNYTYSGSATGDIQVQFDNDASGRDVVVDYIQVDGETRQAEDQSTNTGVWQDGACGGGGHSQWLHCNGYIDFGSTGASSSITIEENITGFCSVDGTVDSNHSGFNGSGFANTDNALGTGVDWSVNVPADGNYILEWRYANGSSTNRPGSVLINGTSGATVDFPSTGAWSSWTSASANITLSAGYNTIRLQATASAGLGNIDSLTVTGNNPQPATCGSSG